MVYIKKYALILAVVILVILKVVDLFSSDGMTEEEYKARLKYDMLEVYTKQLLIKDKKLEKDYEIIKNNINVDSVFVWDADSITRDSLRAIYNPS